MEYLHEQQFLDEDQVTRDSKKHLRVLEFARSIEVKGDEIGKMLETHAKLLFKDEWFHDNNDDCSDNDKEEKKEWICGYDMETDHCDLNCKNVNVVRGGQIVKIQLLSRIDKKKFMSKIALISQYQKLYDKTYKYHNALKKLRISHGINKSTTRTKTKNETVELRLKASGKRE